MTDLNSILSSSEEIQFDTRIEDWTDLCLNFSFSVLNNILKKMDECPVTLLAFLSMMLTNTRDEIS